jgi:type IV pilus assembly protein PilA
MESGERAMNPRESNHTFAARRRAQAGFSLIELLVVVAVILIIAAIAIPNYIQSKMRANESSAVQSLRNLDTAELVYSSTYGIDFTPSLSQLSGNGLNPDPNNAGLIDEVLASGVKQGYRFTYTALTFDASGNTATYSINADPVSSNVTGQRHFYTDQSCVIRSNIAVPAGPSDLPL